MTTSSEIIRKDKALRVLGDASYQVLGNIVLNGPEGVISIFDDTLYEIVALDQDGMTIDIPSSENNQYKFIHFEKEDVRVGDLALWRYITGGVTVSDMIFRSYEKGVADEDTYATMDIYDNDLTTRRMFFQFSTSYRSSVLQQYQWNFSVHNKTGSFVIVGDADGLGHIRIPSKASDPSAENGRMYYNTVSNKFKVCEGSTWKTITTS